MLNTIFRKIWEKKSAFLGTFFLVFTLSYIILVAIDFLPEPVTDQSAEEANTFDPAAEVEVTKNIDSVEELPVVNNVSSANEVKAASNDSQVFPTSIYIEKLGKTTIVKNPSSRTIADLDAALLEGVVRHPDSATLDQEGNVFMLGHSSYLPTVFNKNFQAFNGIQNLEWGDSIEVSSDGTVYKYRVEKVYRALASDVTVPIAGTGKKLTLATCNSFGSIDDRYIVEAKQISTRKL